MTDYNRTPLCSGSLYIATRYTPEDRFLAGVLHVRQGWHWWHETDAPNGDRLCGTTRGPFPTEAAAIRDGRGCYDHTREGEPAADMAPSKVRSTPPLHDVREIAPGLYAGRNEADELQLVDVDYHRGYITRWPTSAKPDGWRVHTWNGHDLPNRLELRRTFPNRLEAERALIREGRKLAQAAAIAA